MLETIEVIRITRSLEHDNIDIGVLRRTKECSIKHFAFYYNNVY